MPIILPIQPVAGWSVVGLTSIGAELRFQVGGVPDALLSLAILRGCRKLAERAKVPTYTATIAVVADTLRYAVTMPDADHEPLRLIEVKLDGGELDATDYSLDLATGEVVFEVAPSGAELTVEAVIQPLKTAASVNALFLTHEDAVMAWARHWLRSQAGTSWHEPSLAIDAEEEFNKLAGRIQRMAIKGQTNAAIRVRSHFF